MMTVADTSRQHYKDMIESGELSGQMKTVFTTLDKLDDPVTLNELHKMFLPDIPKSTISGRLNDLQDKGLVTGLSGDGKREDRISGIKCKTWTTSNKKSGDVREWVDASHTFEESSSDKLDDLIQPIENNDKENGESSDSTPAEDVSSNPRNSSSNSAAEPPKQEQLTSKKRNELEAGDKLWG